MLNVRKHARLAVPVGAALVAAAAVGGPALASTSSHATAHAAATTRGKTGPRGPRGHTGARGLQGPQGPAGASGSNGAPGATGTAGGGGAEGTILYAANPPAAAAPNTTPTNTPTVIYSGHGLAFAATCSSDGPVLTLQAAGGDAITVNKATDSPTPTVTTALNDYSKDLTSTGVNDVLFASTDGSVVQLHFQESSTQTGAQCFIYGTRIGG